MTDQEIKIREMEERIKKLEDVVFDQWLSQYGYGKPNIPTNYHPECDFEHNYTWKPDDVPPYVPTHACSQEHMARALTDYNTWVERRQVMTDQESQEIKKVSTESLNGCPFLHNIKKKQSEWAEIWDNFCPRGGSVSYFVPDNEENK